LFDSGQGRREKSRFGKIIKTDDSNIVRDSQPPLAGDLQHAQCHLIVANEKRIHFNIMFKKFFEYLRAALR
jgi:hypothetical protein